LAKHLKLQCRPIVEQFRKLKDGKQPESYIKKLTASAATYPGNYVECERGFSTINDIAWDKRNALRVQTVSDLMFLALNGPPLDTFEPLPYVRSWLEHGRRKSTASMAACQSFGLAL